MDDLYDRILVKETLPVVTRSANTTTNGTVVDREEDNSGYQGAMFMVHTGTMTDGTHTIDVQESDASGSGFASVGAANLLGTPPAIASTDDNKIFEIGYLGGKRYLRVAVTVSGATSGGVYGSTIILGDPRVSPVIRN